MPSSPPLPFSVLDLSPILRGGDAGQALRNTLDLARHAERLGYRRYWVAEHHNMPGIASAATSVVIGHVAGGTATIRVGSGGIMLPNHSPLVIAEQFGTLASLYPGRIDLGVGRAPGTDPRTTYALRRERMESADSFPRDLVELQGYFRPAAPGQAVRAVPGAGLEVPIWLLGSSLFSAHLAASLGLPYAFAAHFAPDHLDRALEIYREEFKPSEALAAPQAMVAVGVYAAETDAEAARLFTSAQQQILNLRRGDPTPLNPPVASMEGRWSSVEKAMVENAQRETIVGAPETVRRGLAALVERTAADEVIVAAQIFDHAARLRSYELVAGLRPAPLPAARGR
jgi:luciferase family oxidoreductase group 1